mmetsp:Transcript_11825/g.45786  ORF Transcript_11825/g.45786 Transcript_11825/m.45786 type:complete len:355 (+) Transcript_11825:127-1191(+)
MTSSSDFENSTCRTSSALDSPSASRLASLARSVLCLSITSRVAFATSDSSFAARPGDSSFSFSDFPAEAPEAPPEAPPEATGTRSFAAHLGHLKTSTPAGIFSVAAHLPHLILNITRSTPTAGAGFGSSSALASAASAASSSTAHRPGPLRRRLARFSIPELALPSSSSSASSSASMSASSSASASASRLTVMNGEVRLAAASALGLTPPLPYPPVTVVRGLSGAAGDAMRPSAPPAGARPGDVEPYPRNLFSPPRSPEPRDPPRIGAISAFRRFSSSIAAASTSSSYSESSESSDDDAGFDPSDPPCDPSDSSTGTQLSNFAIFGDSRKNGVSPSLTSSVSRSDGGAPFGSKG